MRSRIALTALISILVASCHPAAAWDADWGWSWDEPDRASWRDELVYDLALAYDPTPAYEPQPAWERPVAAPDRYEAMREAGLYQVTEVHDQDLVISDGPRTTYTTTTESEDPGTAARLVMHVGSGELTGLEETIVNGRLTRTDGMQAAGDLYQNFYWDGTAWMSNGLYFFNDDSELAQQQAWQTDPPGGSAGLSPAVPSVVATSGAALPIGSTRASTSPSEQTPMPSTAGDTLWSGSLIERQMAEPEVPAGSSNGPPHASTAAPRHHVEAGIALESQGDVLGRIEVLRGRAVRLWPRAFVDGAPGSIVAWRLTSGELTALGPVAAGADQPLAAMWDHVAPGGATFPVQIDADVAVPGEGVRTVQASLTVLVRSPALVE